MVGRRTPMAVRVSVSAACRSPRTPRSSAAASNPSPPIAFPVSVGGEVIAVLYAEVDDALSPQRRMSKDALDTLTRHAGRVLETITVQQAAGLRPLRRVSTASRSGHSLGERLS